MTPHEAKKDLAARLKSAGVEFAKLTARTISFEALGFGRSLFITMHGAKFPAGKDHRDYMRGVPKPSEGGYCVEYANDCTIGGALVIGSDNGRPFTAPTL